MVKKENTPKGFILLLFLLATSCAYAQQPMFNAQNQSQSQCTTPAAPTANAASSITCSSFSANWSVAATATTYYLDVSTVSSFSSFVAGYNNLNAGNVTTYSVTGLSGSTAYYYRIRAGNSCGTSANSNTITTTTSSGSTPAAPTASAATNYKCSGGGTSGFPQATAHWTTVSGATGYYVDISYDNFVSLFQTDNVTPGSASSETIYPDCWSSIYYRVRAYSCGSSSNSNVITVSAYTCTICMNPQNEPDNFLLGLVDNLHYTTNEDSKKLSVENGSLQKEADGLKTENASIKSEISLLK